MTSTIDHEEGETYYNLLSYETTRENKEPQPQAQSRSYVQRHSASDDSSADEIKCPDKSATQ